MMMHATIWLHCTSAFFSYAGCFFCLFRTTVLFFSIPNYKNKKEVAARFKKKMQHVCVPSALKVSSHTSNPSKHNPSYSMADHVQYGYNKNKNIVNDKILKGVLT
jgi:hypothetical protein